MFLGSGTPDHLATAEGDLCPGTSDLWSFSTLDVPIEQHVGVRVFQQQGSISIGVLTPFGDEVVLAPGEEYHAVHGFEAVTYQVTVTGAGTGLSQYRLEACRSISRCRFVVGVPPGATPLSPPLDLSPPIELSPPADLSPAAITALPSTGSSGTGGDRRLRIAIFSVAGAALLFAVVGAALELRRES